MLDVLYNCAIDCAAFFAYTNKNVVALIYSIIHASSACVNVRCNRTGVSGSDHRCSDRVQSTTEIYTF